MSASVREGDIVAGRYRVDRVIGSGAMGLVVAATDLELRAPRALKLMRPSALSDQEAVARFLREARASANLRGRHVARVFEVGHLPSGAPFMVMEHLAGKDLRTVLDERGALPLGEAVAVVVQACEALAEAHAGGIVHRDLKPANLFLAREAGGTAVVKVLDFGVSKILGEASGADVTRSYVMLGSPHYMSPEQMASSRDVDARTDVWAMGVVAYQLLTGSVPFEGKALSQIVSAVLQGQPPPPSTLVHGLPPEIDAAVLACLERDLDRRCPGVAALAAALAPFAPREAGASLGRLLGQDTAPPPGPAPASALPAKAPLRIPMPLLLAGAFLLGGLLAFLLLRLR